MRFLHLADLHLGKSLHGLSLLESGDQPAWVERFLALTESLRPDAVLVAGDVYDRSAPSGDAVELLDRLLTGLAEREIPTLLVAGNHDSGQRLAFAGSLLAKQHLYIAGTLPQGGRLERVTLRDEYGPVHFWLLPYTFPALAARALGDETIRDYGTALGRLLAAQKIDFSQRNVLVAHQNVTWGGQEVQRGGSESTVGGLGQVDASVFDGFSYVALGHIHAACPVGKSSVRYAGSPLCYHFDELRQPQKGPLLVTLGALGEEPRTETLLIPPLHPLRELRGSYEELRAAELAECRRGEYLRIVLTDWRPSPEIGDFFRQLARARESEVLELLSEYRPYGGESRVPAAGAREKSVEELFADFYTERCGEAPGEAELELLHCAGELMRHREPGTPLQKEIEALLEALSRQEVQE